MSKRSSRSLPMHRVRPGGRGALAVTPRPPFRQEGPARLAEYAPFSDDWNLSMTRNRTRAETSLRGYGFITDRWPSQERARNAPVERLSLVGGKTTHEGWSLSTQGGRPSSSRRAHRRSTETFEGNMLRGIAGARKFSRCGGENDSPVGNLPPMSAGVRTRLRTGAIDRGSGVIGWK